MDLGIVQMLRNLWDTASEELRPSAIIPPSIWSTIEWTLIKVPQALGFGSPAEQVVGSVVVALAMIVASLGVLTYLAVLLIPPFLVGVARHHETVDKYWRAIIPELDSVTGTSWSDIKSKYKD